MMLDPLVALPRNYEAPICHGLINNCEVKGSNVNLLYIQHNFRVWPGSWTYRARYQNNHSGLAGNPDLSQPLQTLHY